jgi:hypothetical protein
VNLLIIGGLLVLAVVAILGAVLLSRSGEANGAATKTTPALQAPSQPSTPPAPATEASSAAAANSQHQSLLNGQFHEMADEIRTLHLQAWQLEQRLSALSEMVNQIELTRNDDGSVETDAHRSPSESIWG